MNQWRILNVDFLKWKLNSNLLKKYKFATALEKVASKQYKLEESFKKMLR